MATPNRSESEVLAEVRRFLRVSSIFHLRMQSGAQKHVYKGRERWVMFGAVGMADLLAFPQVDLVPVPVWIETKSPHGKLSAAQALFRRGVLQQGHAYCLA